MHYLSGAPGYQLYSGKNCDGNVISTVYVSSVKECAEVCYRQVYTGSWKYLKPIH